MAEVLNVDGLSAVIRGLKQLDAQAPELVKAENRKAADTALAAARPEVPVVEGDLLGTLRAGATRRTGYVAAGSKAVPYAGPIHFGWGAHNIAPQPFLTTALGGAEQRIVSDWQAGVVSLIDKVGLS